MRNIVSNNRTVLLDPVGSRIWSGWIIQQYNSAAVAMGAFSHDLFMVNQMYWLLPFAIFIGFFLPIPFWIVYKLSPKNSHVARLMQYLDLPIILLYLGYLPFSVNGQWWSCVVIGFASQWWARTRRPKWFKKVWDKTLCHERAEG
jgi:OPT oligopeptide transporter protein